MRALFSDGNRMVSELRWHPNQENCFLWQMLSISLPPSLSLSSLLFVSLSGETRVLSCTHARPILPSFSLLSKLKPPSPQTQTHCAKSSSTRVFQKVKTDHKNKQNHQRKGKQTEYVAMPLYQETNANVTVF